MVTWDGSEIRGTFHIVRSRQFILGILVLRDFRVVRRMLGGESEVRFVPLEVFAGVFGSPGAAIELVDHGLAGVGDGDAVAIVEFLLLFNSAERVALGEDAHGGLDAHGIGVGEVARHFSLIAGGKRNERKRRQ